MRMRSEEPELVALRYTPADTVFMARELFEALVEAYTEMIRLRCYTIETST